MFHYLFSSFVLLIAVLWSSVNRTTGAFCDAFLLPNPTLLVRVRPHVASSEPQGHHPHKHHRSPSVRRMVAADIDSADAFTVLGLDPYDGTFIDKKVIKKAFRKLAIRYHPDAVTNKDSSEYDKKWASEQFTKISMAYEELLGQIHEQGFVTPPPRNLRKNM